MSYNGDGRFSLPDEHAIPLTDETSPACVIGAFEIAVGSVYATDTIAERFRTGDGFAWGAHDPHVLGGCERFFRPGYLNNLASTWIPALDGVEAKLAAGARVADVGCGHGASTLLLGESYPASTVVGFDAHDGSVDAARTRAAEAGLADRVNSEVASATGPTTWSVSSTASTTWVTRPARAPTYETTSLRVGRSCSSSRSRTTTFPITSTLSGPPTTRSQPCSAPLAHCPKTWAPPSAHKPGKLAYERS